MRLAIAARSSTIDTARPNSASADAITRTDGGSCSAPSRSGA
jgi:hypothetical protein